MKICEAITDDGCECGGPAAGEGGTTDSEFRQLERGEQLVVSLEEALSDDERILVVVSIKAPAQPLY